MLTASFCGANEVPGFHEAVASIPELIREGSSEFPDVVTRIVGIAVDQDAREGVEYLLRLADFDEIVAGGGWLNTATEKLLWGAYVVEAGVPQVIVLERTVLWDGSAVRVSDERIVERVVDANAIVEWVDRGAALTALSGREVSVRSN